MTEYVDAEVRDLRDSESEEQVTLLVGVSGSREEFAADVEQYGATVEAELGHATLRITASQSAIDSICKLEGLKSIELERDDVRVLDRGNVQSRQRLTR